MANKREVAASFAGKQRVSQAQIYQLVKARDVTAIVVVGWARHDLAETLNLIRRFLDFFAIARPRATACRKKRQSCHRPS